MREKKKLSPEDEARMATIEPLERILVVAESDHPDSETVKRFLVATLQNGPINFNFYDLITIEESICDDVMTCIACMRYLYMDIGLNLYDLAYKGKERFNNLKQMRS